MVWQEKRRLKDRLNEHRQPVDKPNIISKPTTVSEHFVTANHFAFDMHLIRIPIQQLYSAWDFLRKVFLITKASASTLEPLALINAKKILLIFNFATTQFRDFRLFVKYRAIKYLILRCIGYSSSSIVSKFCGCFENYTTPVATCISFTYIYFFQSQGHSWAPFMHISEIFRIGQHHKLQLCRMKYRRQILLARYRSQCLEALHLVLSVNYH